MFHAADQSDFDGKPLINVVGETRFMSRAKAYFDRTFSGKLQRYSYFLEVPGQGDRLMTCELKPYRDPDGSVKGALFEISDITDQIFNMISVKKRDSILSMRHH